MSNNNRFAEYLEGYRKDHDLSLTEFSARLGISRSALQNYCKGKGNPTLSTLEYLANGLGITLSELLDGEDEDA